jgi:hypothetical protein
MRATDDKIWFYTTPSQLGNEQKQIALNVCLFIIIQKYSSLSKLLAFTSQDPYLTYQALSKLPNLENTRKMCSSVTEGSCTLYVPHRNVLIIIFQYIFSGLIEDEKHITSFSIPGNLLKETNITGRQIPSYQKGKLKIYLCVLDTFFEPFVRYLFWQDFYDWPHNFLSLK